MLVVWTLVGVLALRLLLKYLRRKTYNLPPGPSGPPFVGSVYYLDQEKPHVTITEWSEKYGDVIRMNSFGRMTVILNSYETIYEGLVTQANEFAGRVPSFRNELLLSDSADIETQTFSPQWVYRKKIAMQTLKSYGENLLNLEAVTMELIADMLEDLKELSTKGPCDIYPVYHMCTAGIISSIMYGQRMSKENVDQYLKLVEESMAMIQPAGMGVVLDMIPGMRYLPIGALKKIQSYGEGFKRLIDAEIIKRRAEYEPGHPICFTDGLFDHQRKGLEDQGEMQLSDSEIYGINFNMILAGTFTTSTTMNALIAVLVNKPKIQQKMYDEIRAKLGDRPPRLSDRKSLTYIEAAILEILRYSSIITLNSAHCTMVDTKINGYDIPKDTEVLYNLWKLHHNPEYWDEPWEFKPERYLEEDGTVVLAHHINRKRLLAFGASRRVCAGETLAKNRLFLLVVSLMQRFELLPAGPDEIPRHDPRDYAPSFGIEPHRYRLKLLLRK